MLIEGQIIDERARIEETSTPAIPVFTIGYGARTIEAFIQVLKTHAIAYLIDVRTAPYSRYKSEFGREALELELRRHGIRYVYMGEQLGGRPDDPDCYLDEGVMSDGAGRKVDYEKVKGKEFYRQGLSRVVNAFDRQLRVVLMCSEGKPENCHRSELIGRSLTALGIPVAHIDENDALQTQETVIIRRWSGQQTLFDMPSTSRKRYGGKQEREEEEDA